MTDVNAMRSYFVRFSDLGFCSKEYIIADDFPDYFFNTLKYVLLNSYFHIKQ